MRTPYVGGYFSSVVTSLLYAVLDIDPLAYKADSGVYAQLLSIPLDDITREGVLTDIQLLDAIQFVFNDVIEPLAKKGAATVSTMTLTNVVNNVNVNSIEGATKAAGSGVTSISLIVTIAFVIYNDFDSLATKGSASVTGITLI